MSQAGTCWKLVGKTLGMAFSETGSAVVESTHNCFAFLAEKTQPKNVTPSGDKKVSISERVLASVAEKNKTEAVEQQKQAVTPPPIPADAV